MPRPAEQPNVRRRKLADRRGNLKAGVLFSASRRWVLPAEGQGFPCIGAALLAAMCALGMTPRGTTADETSGEAPVGLPRQTL